MPLRRVPHQPVLVKPLVFDWNMPNTLFDASAAVDNAAK
jgi:hypothetical protein